MRMILSLFDGISAAVLCNLPGDTLIPIHSTGPFSILIREIAAVVQAITELPCIIPLLLTFLRSRLRWRTDILHFLSEPIRRPGKTKCKIALRFGRWIGQTDRCFGSRRFSWITLLQSKRINV
ncbi:hypothetical protein ASE26_29595 [Duganella sp. Root198D2]|nr:hypothetical protein ASE26_29595 [Duganella sp. Root198D2]